MRSLCISAIGQPTTNQHEVPRALHHVPSVTGASRNNEPLDLHNMTLRRRSKPEMVNERVQQVKIALFSCKVVISHKRSATYDSEVPLHPRRGPILGIGGIRWSKEDMAATVTACQRGADDV